MKYIVVVIISLIIQWSIYNSNHPRQIQTNKLGGQYKLQRKKHRLKKNDGLRKMGFPQFQSQFQLPATKVSDQKLFETQIRLQFEEQDMVCKINSIKQLDSKQCRIQLASQNHNDDGDGDGVENEQYSECLDVLEMIKEYDLKLKCGSENDKIFNLDSKSINKSNELIINQIFVYPGTKNQQQNCESYMKNGYDCKVQQTEEIQQKVRKLKHKKPN